MLAPQPLYSQHVDNYIFQRWDTLIQCVPIVTIPYDCDTGLMIEELDDELLAFDERNTYTALDLIESMTPSEIYGHVMDAIQTAAARNPDDTESFAMEMSGILKALYIMERQKRRIESLVK